MRYFGDRTRAFEPARSEEKSRSIEFGERAVELIKHHKLSADPSSYAPWYAYVGGSNLALARAVRLTPMRPLAARPCRRGNGLHRIGP